MFGGDLEGKMKEKTTNEMITGGKRLVWTMQLITGEPTPCGSFLIPIQRW